jgi:hypothetical protein
MNKNRVTILRNPSHIFILWGLYFLIVNNFGYFYNFKFLTYFFLPLALVSIISLSINVFEFLQEGFSHVDKLIKYLMFITMFVLLYIIKMSFFYPDYSWDGQAYHLPTSVEWSKSGKIGLVYVSLYSSTYPGLSELLQALWFRSTNISGPPHNISQLMGLVILSFSVVGIGRTLNWKKSSIILGLIFSLTIPNIILQSTTAYNDLFFSSLVVAGIYFALNFKKSEETYRVINLYGIGIAAGLVASTKFTGAYFAFALFALVLTLNFRGLLKNILHLASSIVLGILICLPWYLRNFENFGNPFYPLSIGFGEFTLFQGSLGTPDKAFFDYFSEKVGIQNSPIGVVRSWFWWPINHPVYDTRVGGSGLAWIGILILTLLIALVAIKNQGKRLTTLQSREVIIGIFVLISVFVVPAGWWPRYVLFFPVIVGIILINWVVVNDPKYQKVIALLLTVTIFESMFYLSYYAGSPTQSYLYTASKSLPEKVIHSTWDTLFKTQRDTVYSLVSPELAPLAEIPSSNIYISDPGHQYFPLYGLNFQHSVLPAFTRDVEPINMPSLMRKKITGFDELTNLMNSDGKPSIFVTRDVASFIQFREKNSTCLDITLKSARTFIASCK